MLDSKNCPYLYVCYYDQFNTSTIVCTQNLIYSIYHETLSLSLFPLFDLLEPLDGFLDREGPEVDSSLLSVLFFGLFEASRFVGVFGLDLCVGVWALGDLEGEGCLDVLEGFMADRDRTSHSLYSSLDFHFSHLCKINIMKDRKKIYNINTEIRHI